ncbi:MAG: GTPase Era [Lachnospiraceae bacterium]|nr:GTPase Era [Lachnospiraceae bacterium]
MQKRSGFVTMIGRPNVGKSTLLNYFVGQKVAITSNKPQTTRNRISGIYTDEERGQIVFVDTPGIHKAKNKLGDHMVKEASSAIGDVDVILWLVEPDERIGGGDEAIAKRLEKADVPVLLVINKADTVAHEAVLPVIDLFSKRMAFDEIVPISAKTGENCDRLLDLIYGYLPYGPYFYEEDAVTDQPERAIVAELVREKALHALSDEVPHGIAVAIDQMKKRKGKRFYDIDATIICEKESHKGIIIGKGGEMLKKIGANARFEIERMLDAKVNLKLWVKVKKNWRDSDYLVKNFTIGDE